MKTKNVIISLLGVEKDLLRPNDPPNKWRPNLALVDLHEEQAPHHLFSVDEIILIYNGDDFKTRATELKGEIEARAKCFKKTTEVTLKNIFRKNPWNLKDALSAYLEFAKTFQYEENCAYHLHLGTGTHVDHICFFLLVKHNLFNARLLRTIHKGKTFDDDTTLYNFIEDEYRQILNKARNEQAQKRCGDLKHGIQTKNKAFNTLIAEIEKVALSPHPILLGGPTGAGKTQLARRIYELKEKNGKLPDPISSSKPKKSESAKPESNTTDRFIPVNCATLTGELAQSALFGHIKGAFTGAEEPHLGYLKEADGGILFLDEIGELSLETQAKLLKALEEKAFRPLGGEEDVKSNFHLICGTNRDLKKEVEEGRFRKDLFYRINMWTFNLPGLKDRPEDIEPNIEYELNLYRDEYKTEVKFEDSARVAFLEFAQKAPWEGNFRDLHTAILRMATFADEKGLIQPKTVKTEIKRLREQSVTNTPTTKETPTATVSPKQNNTTEVTDDSLKQLLDDRYNDYTPLELAMLKAAIPICKTAKNKKQAGERLYRKGNEIPCNGTSRIQQLLNKFSLTFEDLQSL